MSQILRVDELSQQLGPIIEAITPEPVQVRGTLTTWKRSRAWQRGELVTHNDNDVAAKLTIGCKAKRGVAISSRFAAAGTPLEPPVDVTVTGTLTYHPRWGFRFELHSIDPDSLTTADSHTTRAELIERFTQQGLLDRQKGLTVDTIESIGLIIPLSGEAGRGDALGILAPLDLPIIEKRVATSGPKAASQIVSAIQSLENRTDIIAIVRGGGAASDLHIWDTEPVTTAIATCDTPIVIGVGHSTDEHLSRRVAWHGATTPTAAAVHIANIVAPANQTVIHAPAGPETAAPQTKQSEYLTGHVAPTQIKGRSPLKKIAVVLLIAIAIAIAYWFGTQT